MIVPAYSAKQEAKRRRQELALLRKLAFQARSACLARGYSEYCQARLERTLREWIKVRGRFA